ncbi:pilus assembly protein PilM, partial [bacterium]|nr:pilus assembly protein PilM [bacterium]
MKCVGIDIGTFSIKIVELNGNSKSATLKSYTEIPLSQEANKDHKIEIIDALRSFTLSFEPGETHFVVGLNEDKIIHRRLNFPFKERYNILKSLPFELEEVIPMTQDNAVFDAKILYYEGNNSEVFTSAVHKQHVDDAINLCNDCNFDPHIISADGLAFSNIFEQWNGVAEEKTDLEAPDKRSAHLVLNIGHTNTTLLAYVQNELLSVRNFKWGGKDIAENVARKYHIQYSEALEELKEKAYILIDPEGATEAQLQFSDTIKESITSFGHDLKLAIMDIASQFDVEFEQISICGGTTKIKNLNAAITQEVEISCNMLTANPHNISNADPQFNLIEGATALGLAIEGLKLARNPATNFLQGHFAKTNKDFEKLYQKWGHAARIAGMLLVVFFVYAIMRENYSAQMIEQSRESLKSQAKSVAGIKTRRGLDRKIKTYIKNQEKVLKNYNLMKSVNNVNSALDFLAKFSKSSPAN